MDEQSYTRAYEHGFCRDPGRLQFYREEYLFQDAPLRGRSLLDIGGGRGLFSYYTALRGASQVVVMEPEFDGSLAGMIAGFERLHELLGHTRPGSNLIICDCSNQNVRGQLFGWNPMQRTIEWQKHQPPEFWAQLLSQRGLRVVRTSWSSPNMLGSWGRLLLGNRWAAWLTYSHFRLEMVRV